MSDPEARAIAAEQPVVDRIHARLDQLRAQTRSRLTGNLAARPSTPQGRAEREALVARDTARLRAFATAGERLVFGRLDTVEGTLYVGRLGLLDHDRKALLVDWRAEAAEGFYRATAADPGGVVRRRHLTVRHHRVVGVVDDLVTGAVPDAVPASGDAVLVDALQRPRTGRMQDIVTTIQAEQDRIIREPLAGVLVVEGGPGTGKTAVALHRIAYLLHRHRDRLERSGVLLLGPNSWFLEYVEEVLPNLGETSVVSATVAGLCPEVRVSATDPDDVAALKGSARMVPVLRALVAAQQRVPVEPVRLDVDGTTVLLRPGVAQRARAAARATREPHNVAREEFCRLVLDDLLDQLAVAEGADEQDHPDLLKRLHDSVDVRREVNLCWLPRTPAQLLERLRQDPRLLERCAPQLTGDERLLLRSRGAGWSEADVPLLDELATLLGPPPQSAAERAARRRRAEEERERQAFAADSLTSFGLVGHLSAEELAARLAEGPATWSLVDHGLTDREWAFGHVVIDEAQELSEMAWRMVFRRCPARSMTLVGDLNQTGSPAGVSDWSVLLDRHARGRWRRARLTVNYRTPRPIAEAAAQLLRARGADVEQPESVRDGDPVQVVKADDLAGQLDALVREALRSTSGTVAVLVPPDMGVPVESHDRLSVLSAKDAKGLEFDHVLVVEPAGFLESPCGAQDLYVGLTRATRKLTIVHTRELPPGLWLPAMGAACEGAP